MNNLRLLFIACFLCLSCSNDDGVPIERAFFAKMNGEDFIPSETVFSTTDEDHVITSSNDVHGTIMISVWNETAPGTYDDSHFAVNLVYTPVATISSVLLGTKDGTIDIIENSETTLKGTFSMEYFDVLNPQEVGFTITEGEFNIDKN